MGNILIQEECVDRTRDISFGRSDVYETYFEQGQEGKLFRHLQKEYGKCVSKVYIDKGLTVKAIGWVFEKTECYDDTHEPFTQETWVTIHTAEPTRTIEHHYHYLS